MALWGSDVCVVKSGFASHISGSTLSIKPHHTVSTIHSNILSSNVITCWTTQKCHYTCIAVCPGSSSDEQFAWQQAVATYQSLPASAVEVMQQTGSTARHVTAIDKQSLELKTAHLTLHVAVQHVSTACVTAPWLCTPHPVVLAELVG